MSKKLKLAQVKYEYIVKLLNDEFEKCKKNEYCTDFEINNSLISSVSNVFRDCTNEEIDIIIKYLYELEESDKDIYLHVNALIKVDMYNGRIKEYFINRMKEWVYGVLHDKEYDYKPNAKYFLFFIKEGFQVTEYEALNTYLNYSNNLAINSMDSDITEFYKSAYRKGDLIG